MLRNRSLQFKLLLLAFFAETILSNDDDLKRLCVDPKYDVERRTEELAYDFCKGAFPQLFKSDANTAYQTLLAPAKVPTPTPVNERNTVFKECPALLLLAPEWTVGLLRRQGQARQRLMDKWRRLMERPVKLKELIFFACMSTFANEQDVIYIDWPEKMKEKNKCPELSTEASKFEDVQSLAGNINIMTTKSEAEQNRKEAAYAFCRALHAEFSEEWTSEKAGSLQTENWSLGVDVWLVPGCPYAALLQPEVRMMRERREIEPKLRKQLGKFLFWPQVMGEKEDEALKSATLELCKFAFLPEKEGGMSTLAIVIICISCALLLIKLIIFAARCTWSYYQRKKKTKEEAELAWTNGTMGEQDQIQSTKTTQKNSPTSMFEEDSTLEDSAKTLDMQPSEENFQPLKDDKTTEEGSMMKTAMMPLPLDGTTDQTFDTAMTRETDQSGR